MTDASRLKATLYIGGLDDAVNERILADAFLPFGEVVDVSIPKPENPSPTNQHKGFGYVEFESAEDAVEAMDNMDQSELFGRVLKVAPAKPQKEGMAGLGSRVAIWEQVGYTSVPSFQHRIKNTKNTMQEGWLARHAISEEDKQAAKADHSTPLQDASKDDQADDLVGLDLAGPRPV